MFFKGCDDVNTIVLHAFDDLLLHLGLVVVQATEDEVFSEAIGKHSRDGAAGGIAEFERFFDLILGKEGDDFFAKFPGVRFEELETAIAFDNDCDGENEERKEGPHEKAPFEEKLQGAGLKEAGSEGGMESHDLFVEICFAFKLSEEFREGKTTAGVFRGIAFGEVPAASVVPAEGAGDVFSHTVAFASPEEGLGGEFLLGEALGEGVVGLAAFEVIFKLVVGLAFADSLVGGVFVVG